MTVTVRGPHDLPDLRLHLLDAWREGSPFDRSSAQYALMMEQRSLIASTGERPERFWHQNHLRAALLWWVAAPMVDVVEGLAKTIPTDARPTEIPGYHPEWWTKPHLICFARPVRGTDARLASKDVLVDAVLVGPTKMGPAPPIGRPHESLCVSVSSYRCVDFGGGLTPDESEAAALYGLLPKATQRRLDPAALMLTGKGWYPLGRMDWPLDESLATPIDLTGTSPEIPDGTAASHVEDRRLVAALMLVAGERRMADWRSHPVDRAARRRSQRAGVTADVNVLYLRRVDDPRGRHDDPGDSGRHVGVTYWVDPHPVWQPYGPGSRQRKLITRAGHYRGQGPISGHGPTVHGLIR